MKTIKKCFVNQAVYLVVIFPCLLVAWGGTLAQEAREKSSFSEAMRLVQLSDYRKAVDAFDEVLSRDGAHASALTYKGFCLVHMRRFDEAIKYFEKAIDTQPEFLLAWQGKFQVFAITGRRSEANDCQSHIHSCVPQSASDFLAYGSLCLATRAWDDAIKNLTKAVELDPSCAEAFNLRGGAYRQKKQYDQAIQDFDAALAANPQYVEAYTNRGNAYRHKGNVDKAIEDHTKAISFNEGFAPAYFNRGRAYIEKAAYDLAKADWQRTVELEPSDSRYRQLAENNLRVLQQKDH